MASALKGEQVLLRNFFIFGVFFGLCFPIMALGIDFWVKETPFSLNNILTIHFVNPIHFIIDSAPIILSFTSYRIGKLVISRERRTRARLKAELAKSQKVFAYAKNLLEGNFTSENDEMYADFQSLIALKEKLLQSRKSEQEVMWESKGLTLLSEIIRSGKASKLELCKKLIAAIAKYSDFEMGMLYVIIANPEGEALTSMAAYAPQSLEALFVEVEAGEGLVGQCFTERKVIHLQDLPENYMEITSGLGKKQPNSLILCPLLFNEEVYGVLELASLSNIEPHKISYIKKASEYLGYTFSYLKFVQSDLITITHKG